MIFRKQSKTGYRYYNEKGKRVSENTFKRSIAQLKYIAEKNEKGNIRFRDLLGRYIAESNISLGKSFLQYGKEKKPAIRFFEKETKLLRNDKQERKFISAEISSYEDNLNEVYNRVKKQYLKKEGITGKKFDEIVSNPRKYRKEYNKINRELSYYIRREVTYKDIQGKEHTINILGDSQFNIVDIEAATAKFEEKIINIYEFLNGDSISIVSEKTFLERSK